MNEAFGNQALVEKLSKLNNSQQSIETLSNWCIVHRKKSKEIVETWDQAFNSSPREKRVPFLYLANDILQNSRRKGSEFVNEFWKVLPGCLKNVYENGEDHGKKVVNRLVEIWDERKVFGSRGRSLKDEILGNVPVPVSDNGKSSNPIKLVRKDANSVRIKLAIGEMPEKIVTAYQSVLDEHSGEDTALSKCKDAVQVLERMEIDIDVACKQGNQQESTFIDNLQEQEIVLKQCIEQLEIAKATRATLITQLMEAIKEQELKLELIHSQLQIAHSQTEHASNMRRRLGLAAGTNGFGPTTTLPLVNFASEAIPATEPNPPVSVTHLQPLQPVTSFVSSLSSAEEDHKKAAAAVAAKLAASSSSAQVLSSILSSLAAEEAASMNNSLSSRVRPGSPPVFPLEKRPRLENTISTTDMGKTSYFGQAQHQQQQSIPLVLPQTSAASIQLPQSNQAPPTFTPPLPPLPPPPMQQYVQTSGGTMSVPPYGFVGRSLPPPPPLLSHVSAGLARPGGLLPPPPPPPPPQQQQQPPPQLQSTSMGFYQSPGIGFYGQPQTAPTAQRQ
ncbi:hypothetical protein C4D60_Mb04t02250 [Musa balbisiana]|uniref:CID domain-containing protein n=1 Tax=Musa balbisiana TaxID=52838 RepID=A0A4V4H9G8_MUSBA|nr:hypothetical protein C4D60_Mb04t02250 [Musa balbisiana]